MLLPWFVPSGMLLSDTAATRNMATQQMESKARPVLPVHFGRPRSQMYATRAPGFAERDQASQRPQEKEPKLDLQQRTLEQHPWLTVCCYHGLSPGACSSRIPRRLGIWQHGRWRAKLDPFCESILDVPAPRCTPHGRLASRNAIRHRNVLKKKNPS